MNGTNPPSPGSAVHGFELCIGADHPSLPGHFPGSPVVPGVLLLDCVIAQAETWLGHALDIAQLQQAKFLAPVLPQQRVDVRLELSATGKLAFTIGDRASPHATGVFTLRNAALA